jgi:hypothetical protein
MIRLERFVAAPRTRKRKTAVPLNGTAVVPVF